MKLIWFLSILTLVSCSSPKMVTSTFQSQFGDLDILSIEHKKNNGVVLLVMDDDTVSPSEQLYSIDKIYNGRKSIYALPKMNYKNVLRKNNTDSPKLRLDNLVDAYLFLVSNNVISNETSVTVLGIGEGSILAPHFSLNIHANNLVLINPFYISMGQNFGLSMTEKSKSTTKIQEELRLIQFEISFVFQKETINLPSH